MGNNKEELVYIDTNIIYGYAKKLAREYFDDKERKRKGKAKDRKTEIRTDNILDKLKRFNYAFIKSYLTNFEVLDDLRNNDNVPIKIGWKILTKIIDEYSIIYCRRKTIDITPDFINLLLREKLRLRDGLHIEFARKPHTDLKQNLTILTGDKKMYQARKIYPFIENPNNLLEKHYKKSR